MIKKCSLGILCLAFNSVYAAGTLTYGQFQRINDPLDEQVANSYLQFDLDEKREKGRWDVVAKGSIRHYSGERGLIYAMPELYVSRHIGRSEFTLGRKVIDWNSNDQFWAMGEINALKNFNLLETEREGLFGFHFHRRYKNFHLTVFASGVNVPQINPTFTAKDGKIEGKNEWSNLPPQFVRFRGNDVPVFYEVIYPKAQEIALQEALVLKLDFLSEKNEVNLYGGRKPEPGIRIVATGYYEPDFGGQANVQAKPFVNHQNFWGLGYGHYFSSRESESGLSAHVSIDGVVPDRGTDTIFDEFETLKIQPVYDRITYSAASLKWRSPFLSASVNGLYLIDGDKIDTNVFARKPRWRRSLGANLSYQVSDRWRVSGDYKYDLKMRDAAFIFGTDYRFTKHLSLGLKGQVIDSPNESSFWAPYRSNDTFLGEASYRF